MTGTWLVVGMIALAVALAVFAVWYQRQQTHRCLAFYGIADAQRIQVAPRVELWRPAPPPGGTPSNPTSRTDVSAARGIVHLRRGLVEDANFAWNLAPPSGSPAFGLAFFDAVGDPTPGTVLLVGLDARGGWLAVDGRPGAIALGRLAAGLRSWLADVAGAE